MHRQVRRQSLPTDLSTAYPFPEPFQPLFWTPGSFVLRIADMSFDFFWGVPETPNLVKKIQSSIFFFVGEKRTRKLAIMSLTDTLTHSSSKPLGYFHWSQNLEIWYIGRVCPIINRKNPKFSKFAPLRPPGGAERNTLSGRLATPPMNGNL